MKPITQTNKNNPYPIQRWGCRTMALLAIPQLTMQRPLKWWEVCGLYGEVAKDRAIVVDPEQCLMGSDEHKLINDAFVLMGSKKTARQIGYVDELGVARDWGDRPTDDYQFVIQHWQTNGRDGHFTIVDRAGNEFDPHDPKEAGYTINKKKVVRKLIYRVTG